MKLLVALSALLLSTMIAATPLQDIVVFGDSLSDNGNLYEQMKHQLPQSPPYYEGRFSNGLVWNEYLANAYFPSDSSSHLLNYAFGGAGVTDEEEEVLLTLNKEIDTYLISHHNRASADSLFIIWIGANNYLGLPDNLEETVVTATSSIGKSLSRLRDKGAKHILVINLPDLGKTPAAIEFDAVAIMSQFSARHNQLLATQVEHLKQRYPDVDWLYLDAGAIFQDAVDNPTEFGLSNVNETCIDLAVDDLSRMSVLQMVARALPKQKKDNCNGYLFFDLVHPTTIAHQVIAEQIQRLLQQEGMTFSK